MIVEEVIVDNPIYKVIKYYHADLLRESNEMLERELSNICYYKLTISPKIDEMLGIKDNYIVNCYYGYELRKSSPQFKYFRSFKREDIDIGNYAVVNGRLVSTDNEKYKIILRDDSLIYFDLSYESIEELINNHEICNRFVTKDIVFNNGFVLSYGIKLEESRIIIHMSIVVGDIIFIKLKSFYRVREVTAGKYNPRLILDNMINLSNDIYLVSEYNGMSNIGYYEYKNLVDHYFIVGGKYKFSIEDEQTVKKYLLGEDISKRVGVKMIKGNKSAR